MPPFIPGLDLSELFFAEAVKPILDRRFPDLRYSAALIGPGSEILGFDTPLSRDHSWGPRLMLFMASEDYPAYRPEITAALSHELSHTFRGYSTNFAAPDAEGVKLLQKRSTGPINHHVDVLTVQGFFEDYLGLDPAHDLTPREWLILPEQQLLTVTAGRVFHDGLGELHPRRERLSYYPRDVWLYLMACQWGRIGQEEAFLGRTGDVGDELGSAIVGARLVRDLMKLCFLIERKYAPYTKWFGTAFGRLGCAPRLDPILRGVLSSTTWPEREQYLARAYTLVAEMHNALGITRPLPTTVSRYHDRPYLVIHAETFDAAIRAAIADETVRAIPARFGAVDQWVDSTDVLSYPRVYRRLDIMYE